MRVNQDIALLNGYESLIVDDFAYPHRPGPGAGRGELAQPLPPTTSPSPPPTACTWWWRRGARRWGWKASTPRRMRTWAHGRPWLVMGRPLRPIGKGRLHHAGRRGAPLGPRREQCRYRAGIPSLSRPPLPGDLRGAADEDFTGGSRIGGDQTKSGLRVPGSTSRWRTLRPSFRYTRR